MVAKSGCPVMGHTQVNSGHSNRISYSRAGRGLGNVSSLREGCVDLRGDSGTATAVFVGFRTREW
jgi:hypothetical protein